MAKDPEILSIIADHKLWLAHKGGRQANFTNARLHGADFFGARLDQAIFAGASLHDGNFLHASLIGANFTGASLVGSNFSHAILDAAVLTGADFTRCSLDSASVQDADVARAKFNGASLESTVFLSSNLRGADLSGARFFYTNFVRADLSGTVLSIDVPVVEEIDAKILAAVTENPDSFNMTNWHERIGCGTAHCRAGWAVALAGPAGYSLEADVGSLVAGALIYKASRSGQRIPDFYATNDDALADIRMMAGKIPLQEHA